MASLWGIRRPLALAGAKLIAPDAASSGDGMKSGSSMMLCDDTLALCEALTACRGKEILIVLDNCGLYSSPICFWLTGSCVWSALQRSHCTPRTGRFSCRTQPKDLGYHIDWLAEVEPELGGAMAG